jgi:hypothetical protein
MFRESEKNLKATPGLSFFIILVSEAEKEIKSLERHPLEPFNECERKQYHSTIFSCLESLKRA